MNKTKKNKKIFLIIAIVVFVNLGLFIYFRSQDQTKIDPTTSGQQPVDQPVIQQDLPPVDQPIDQPASDVSSGSDSTTADSSAITIGGVLIGDGNPWTLIYDAPGSPAATLELVFTDSSLCDFGQGDTSCTPMYYEVGTGIEVTGQKDGSKLTVSRIKRSVALMGQ